MTRDSSLNRLFRAADILIDDHVGVIRCVKEVTRKAGAPDFFHFYGQAANTHAFSRQKNFAHTGGASADRAIAMAKAIGEAVERYCSALYEMVDLPLVSFSSAPFPCVPPEEFTLYSGEQYASSGFAFVPFKRSTHVRWTPTIEAASRETWYVPASMVFMPYYFDEQHGEYPIGQRISTGLACHCSFAEAAVSAICEVVERDAFTITWQAQLAPPRICIDTLSERNHDLVDRFERTGYSVTLFNITLDVGIPSVLGVLRGESSERPALVFAASSSLDSEEAVRKSLEELAHTARLCSQLKVSTPAVDPGPEYEKVLTQHDHVRLYCDHANRLLADFLFSSKQLIAFDEIENLATDDAEQALNVLVKQIRSVNHQVLLADLTTPDVGDLGLRVVRAIIPGFHPLFMSYRYRALGGSRLWEVPPKLGYKGICRETGDNAAPHPYP